MKETSEKKQLIETKTKTTLPAELIQQAIEKGSNLEQIEKLMMLQERWTANEAKKAYVRAMSEFKANAPLIDKDKVNNQYKSKYTSLGNLINRVSPVLSKYGLSASWDIEQNGIIKVICKMTHELGHSETASMSAPADLSGAKNPIQQIKSTITYLKAVTFESITGLASTDVNLDDDGNVAAVELINAEEINKIEDLLIESKTDVTKFLTYLKVESVHSIPKAKYQTAVAALEAKLKAVKK